MIKVCDVLSKKFFSIKRYYEELEESMSRIKQKRDDQYIYLCDDEKKSVPTSSLDTSNTCASCTYVPPQLYEVKCLTSNAIKNSREKVSCKQNIPGDCLDVYATIPVWKVFSNNQYVEKNVTLKVGCSCAYVKTT